MSVAIIVVNRTKVTAEDFQSNPIYKKDHKDISELINLLLPTAFTNAIFDKGYFHINSGMRWVDIVEVMTKITEEKYKGILLYLCDDLNAMEIFPGHMINLCKFCFNNAEWFTNSHFKNSLTNLLIPHPPFPRIPLSFSLWASLPRTQSPSSTNS